MPGDGVGVSAQHGGQIRRPAVNTPVVPNAPRHTGSEGQDRRLPAAVLAASAFRPGLTCRGAFPFSTSVGFTLDRERVPVGCFAVTVYSSLPVPATVTVFRHALLVFGQEMIVFS